MTAEPEFKSKGHDSRGVALLKLHGSMNWQSTHTSKQPSPKALFNVRRELTVLTSTQLVHSLTWRRGQRAVYLRPVIVPPISGKRGMMHESLHAIWELAARAIEGSSRVIVVGYSCPPLDLEARVLLSENMRKGESRKELLVVDPKAEVAARFQGICGTPSMRIYASLCQLLGP